MISDLMAQVALVPFVWDVKKYRKSKVDEYCTVFLWYSRLEKCIFNILKTWYLKLSIFVFPLNITHVKITNVSQAKNKRKKYKSDNINRISVTIFREKNILSL